MTHPLTDEMCDALKRAWGGIGFSHNDMRAAYGLGYTQGLEDASDMVTRLQRKGMLQSNQPNKEDNQ